MKTIQLKLIGIVLILFYSSACTKDEDHYETAPNETIVIKKTSYRDGGDDDDAEIPLLMGYVLTTQSLTIPGAYVELIQSGTVQYAAYTNEQGAYYMDHVVSGMYQLSITAIGYRSLQERFDMQDNTFRTDTLHEF